MARYLAEESDMLLVQSIRYLSSHARGGMKLA